MFRLVRIYLYASFPKYVAYKSVINKEELFIKKGTWTKSGGWWRWGREVGSAGVGWRDGEKRHTTVTE